MTNQAIKVGDVVRVLGPSGEGSGEFIAYAPKASKPPEGLYSGKQHSNWLLERDVSDSRFQEDPRLRHWRRVEEGCKQVGGDGSGGKWWLMRRDAPAGTREVDLFVWAYQSQIAISGNVILEGLKEPLRMVELTTGIRKLPLHEWEAYYGKEDEIGTTLEVLPQSPRDPVIFYVRETFRLLDVSEDRTRGLVRQKGRIYMVDIFPERVSEDASVVPGEATKEFFRLDKSGPGVFTRITEARAALEEEDS